MPKMNVYLCRWKGGDISIVAAQNVNAAIEKLDEIGSAYPEDISKMDECMVHLTLDEDGYLKLAEDQPFGEKTWAELDAAHPSLQKTEFELLEKNPSDDEKQAIIRQAVEQERKDETSHSIKGDDGPPPSLRYLGREGWNELNNERIKQGKNLGKKRAAIEKELLALPPHVRDRYMPDQKQQEAMTDEVFNRYRKERGDKLARLGMQKVAEASEESENWGKVWELLEKCRKLSLVDELALEMWRSIMELINTFTYARYQEETETKATIQ